MCLGSGLLTYNFDQGGDYPEIKGVIRTSDGQLKIVEKGGKC